MGGDGFKKREFEIFGDTAWRSMYEVCDYDKANNKFAMEVLKMMEILETGEFYLNCDEKMNKKHEKIYEKKFIYKKDDKIGIIYLKEK